MRNEVSTQDNEYLAQLRENVEKFMSRVALQYVGSSGLLLDVAPQDHKGARPFISQKIQIETLDIDPASSATHIADLCNCVLKVGVNRYDYIVCTEVLEHTRQPFDAVNSIYSMLKQGGLVFVTTPFNFRIHGPLPDCWRFTEHGLRELFKNFEIIEIDELECQNRFLMPIQYTLVARKPIENK
jgi:hypothetical protein